MPESLASWKALISLMTLGRSIVLLLTGLLVGTSLLLGSVAYLTTSASIEDLRGDLLLQVDERVQQRM